MSTPPTQPIENAAQRFSRAEIEAIADPHHRLRVLMQRLLGPGGCPWDREQTHQTLRQYFIEEVYEACEAIDERDDTALKEELGDVGLQVVFHSALAEQRGVFDIDDVYAGICTKLLDRHPHVFGEVQAGDAETVLKNWEQIKKEEKRAKAAAATAKGDEHKGTSVLNGVPRALPALQRAGRLQEKASRVGFDWEKPADVAAKVREEVEEFLEHAANHEGTVDRDAMKEEFGDLMFSLVNLSRFLGFNAEEAADAANNKFIARFTAIEHAAEAQGRHLKEMTLAEMDALWNAAKRGEAKPGGASNENGAQV